MNDEVFTPQVGYRDLKFGMTSSEAVALLGPHTQMTNIWEEFDYDPEDLAAAQDVVMYSFENYPPHHDEELSLYFHKDRLVRIHIQDTKAPLLFRDIPLFGKDRKEIDAQLFALDDDLYGNREKGFYGTLGLIVPWPHFWKQYGGGYISFVDSEFIFDRLDFYLFDPLDAPLK